MTTQTSEPQSIAWDELPPLKFVAEVQPVLELSLHGTADLAYWREALRAEGLEPVATNGEAQVVISATQARFWGLTFRECIVAVQVMSTRYPRVGDGAMFLLQAWNSLRAFAWVERNVFRTPYAHGQLRLTVSPPLRFSVTPGTEAILSAESSGQIVTTGAPTSEHWQGPVYLPGLRDQGRKSVAQKLFVARLSGLTEHFEFDAERDRFRIEAAPQRAAFQHAALQQLLDSRFTPRVWTVRQAAAHAKSQTYRADQFFARAKVGPGG
jgi:hypothetical protein